MRAAVHITTARLTQNRNAVLLLEEVDEWLEGIVDIIRDALGVGATVVLIQVLVDVEDEVVGAAIWVLDLEQGRCRLIRERLRRREVGARKE